MKKPKVFLTGGDGIGWAVDEDLKLTKQAVEKFVDLVDLPESEVVHAVWWWGLLPSTPESLIGKRVICHVPGEPFRYFALPEHRRALSLVGRWITRTRQAALQLKGFGLESDVIPYLIDTETFRPLPKGDPSVTAFRDRWNLPTNAYLIGSFQRDTEGSDLRSPKLVKGPDVLLEILLGLQRRGLNIHAVLAGPRRHWLIRKLQFHNVPFTYIGEVTEGEDLQINALSRPTLNILYNLIDLCVVSSRSEGGPHAVLEATAARCKIVSTPVGMAPEALDPSCIFTCPADASKIVAKDIHEGGLGQFLDAHYQRVHEHHRPEKAAPLFRDLYDKLDSVPVFAGIRPARRQSQRSSKEATVAKEGRGKVSEDLSVSLWHTFFKPPYGGGNQFMMALRKALSGQRVIVRENELEEGIDAYVLNSIHFDVDRFLDFSRSHRLNVVHRIDGPIHLIRGYDKEKDELCYRLNAQFASATVLQSAWTYQRIIEMGYRPVEPVIIHNAVDSEIFNPEGRVPFDPGRKIRLISTSWSNNPRKGGPTYRWIEEHLDWDRYEYTFVGNVSERFERVRYVPPVSSGELASLLREHDIYITASRNDPCSNALIEALACGLPALYLNDGGHPELVGVGGLPFNSEEEILPQLEKLAENYESFRRLITVPTLEDVAKKYLSIIREIVQ
jgi:glycosyltransferase involved in cell wall biosynthesis